MKRTARTPLALLATLGLALAGQVVLPTVAQGAPLLSMAGLTTLDTPGLYDLGTADRPNVVVTTSGVALTGTAPGLALSLNDNVTLTLLDAHITGPASGGNFSPLSFSYCITSCGLVLVGANTARAFTAAAALKVPAGSSLVIEGPGSLNAFGSTDGAGIGGDTASGGDSGAITIRHATVVAFGGTSDNGGPAGIGGGAGSSSGPINIINSSVNAGGGGGASAAGYAGGGAGIGGGGSLGGGGAGNNITITASAVMAIGGGGVLFAGGGAGIGGGGNGGSSTYVVGGILSDLTIDATSVVRAQGGNGDGSSTFPYSGGGGAGIGGGGAGIGGGPATGAGEATNLTVGATLASGSRGGQGSPASNFFGKAGDGALCGTGGRTDGIDGSEVALSGGGFCAEGSQTVDLASRPDPGYAGFPAGPGLTDPADAVAPVGGNASFTVVPHTWVHSFQWQESTDGGTTWNDVVNGGVYAGATSETLALTGVTLAMSGNRYRCGVEYLIAPDAESQAAELTVNRLPVAFTATQAGGTAGTVDSTGIELTFSEPVTGLTAGDITVTNGAGQVTTGVLTEASGTGTNTVWLLEITNVAAQGQVTVAVADFGVRRVTTAAQSVAVHMAMPLSFTDPVGASVTIGGGTSFTVAPHAWATSFQWQTSDDGVTWGNLTDGGVYSGTNTDTLVFTGLTYMQTGLDYRCLVGDVNGVEHASGVAALWVRPIDVTLTAVQVGGTANLADSTGIVLTFSQPVSNLTFGDIRVSDDTGRVTTSVVTEASGTGTNTVWLLEVSSVAAQGVVRLAVSDFDIFTVTNSPLSVNVFKFVPVRFANQLVVLQQTKGGTATVSPNSAPIGAIVTLTATPADGYRFDGWQVSAAVNWVSGDANSRIASFTMPPGGVTVTPRFVLVEVNPPPPPVEPPVQPPPPGPTPPTPVPVTGDTQGGNTMGLLLLASLAGIYAIALRRKHQPGPPARPTPKHLAV